LDFVTNRLLYYSELVTETLIKHQVDKHTLTSSIENLTVDYVAHLNARIRELGEPSYYSDAQAKCPGLLWKQKAEEYLSEMYPNWKNHFADQCDEWIKSLETLFPKYL